MRTLAPALSLEAEANMARAALDIYEAWAAYHRARLTPSKVGALLDALGAGSSACARLKADAQSLEYDWNVARFGYKWEDYCEPDQLAELRRLAGL